MTNESFFGFIRFINLNILKHRAIIRALALRELRVRYKGSVLGFVWTFANPLLMMVIYSAVFGSMFRANVDHYNVYVFGGVLLWNAIAGSLNDGASSLVANASLVTKVALPPEIIPARVILTHFLNYLLTLPLYLAFCIFNHVSLSWATLQIVGLLPLYVLFIFSLVLGLSTLGIIFRDVQYLITSVVFALFFTVPATYPITNLSEKLRILFMISPFTVLVKVNADAMFFGRWVSVAEVCYIALWTVALYAISISILKKYRKRIAERI